MERYRAILAAWRRALARSEKETEFTFSCPQTFWDVRREALTTKEYALLGSLLETQGAADLLLIRTHGEMLPLTILDSIGSLVKAAHWYRVAGDGERAALVGRRAWLEVKLLLDQEESGGFALPEPGLHWYLLEMAGDAAACFDSETAAWFYAEAEVGFRSMDRMEQLANSAENYPGMAYTSELGHPALHHNVPPLGFDHDGLLRIQQKRRNWLRADE